jgi:hypothetical protein
MRLIRYRGVNPVEQMRSSGIGISPEVSFGTSLANRPQASVFMRASKSRGLRVFLLRK